MIINDEPDTVQKYTKLFQRSIDQFKIRTLLMVVERVYVIASSTSILIYVLNNDKCGWDQIQIWVLCTVIQAVFSLILYASIFIMGNNQQTVEKLAFHFAEVIFVPRQEDIEGSLAPETFDITQAYQGQELNKKIEILAMQIRSEIVRYKSWVYYNNIFAVTTNHQIFLWTMYFIIYKNEKGNDKNFGYECTQYAQIQTYVYGFLMFVQFSHYYLLSIILLLLSPIIAGFFIYRCFKDKKNKNIGLAALEELKKTHLYIYSAKLFDTKTNENQLDGEQECAICIQAYNTNDEILRLPCSKLHHFHLSCITAWINLQQTCPSCRKPIYENDQQRLEQPLILE